MNRDLSKVILVDTHPEHISAQPENSILMPKWTGTPGDSGLVGLVPLLESKPKDSTRYLWNYRMLIAFCNLSSYRHSPAAGRQAHLEAVRGQRCCPSARDQGGGDEAEGP